MFSPNRSSDIAEHSICQPGLPGPQGLGQLISPALAFFQRAKSAGSCFNSSTAILAPALSSSTLRPESLPYCGKLSTLK